MAASKTISIGLVIFVLALFSVHCAGGRRGAAEHQVRQLRPTRGFKEMELAAARNFGKRAVNMHLVNSILMEWLALESKMKNLRQRSNLPLPLGALEGVRNMPAMAELQDENAPGEDGLLDE